MPRICLSIAALVGTFALPALADASQIPMAEWRSTNRSGPLKSGDKSGTNWIRHGGTLHARSQKPNGGFYYLPVCRRGGEIGFAVPSTYRNRVQQFDCLGGPNGKLVANGDDYTWEIKQHVAARGNISIYSLSYTWDRKTRVVCKAIVAGNEVPGYFELPPGGELPSGCTVQLMGQMVEMPNYYVAKARTSGLPGLPASGNGWWEPPKDWPPRIKGADPLYRVHDGRGSAVCRAKSSGVFFAGHVVTHVDHKKKRGTACKFRLPGGNAYVLSHDYSVFIGAGGADWGPLRSGSSTNFANAVLANSSSSSHNRTYACQDSAGRAGWVRASTKRCYPVGGSASGVTTFRTLMK
ncbi:MAG: hypothetical protein ACE37F_30465 [Nannocystaceae bacterium]|nr:hypothetical protein [bacterium]